MNLEDRVLLLETELAKLRSDFQLIFQVMQESGGEQNALFAAVLALVRSSQNPGALGPALHHELEQVESMALFQSAHEGQFEGVREAAADLLDAHKSAELARRSDL